MSAILGCKGVQEIDQYPFDLKESDLSELRSKKILDQIPIISGKLWNLIQNLDFIYFESKMSFKNFYF